MALDSLATRPNSPTAPNAPERKKRLARRPPGRRMTTGDGQQLALYTTNMWANILEKYPFDPKRTNVDLKDKWRNMEKAGIA